MSYEMLTELEQRANNEARYHATADMAPPEKAKAIPSLKKPLDIPAAM